MRVLITGGAGLLGRALIATAPRSWQLHATQRARPVLEAEAHTVDLAAEGAAVALCRALRPELIIHAAYSTASPERDIWLATRSVVESAAACGAALIHLSTDALLDGENAPYAEDAAPDPIYEYGRWKARAELHVRAALPAAAIVRTSLLTSFAPLDPRSAWVADSLRRGEPVTLFTDELRCPIAAVDLARQLWEIAGLAPEARGGVWHLAGPEALSRFSLGLLIAAHQGLDPGGIVGAPSAQSATPRPRDLRLLTTRADRMLTRRARPIGQVLAQERCG